MFCVLFVGGGWITRLKFNKNRINFVYGMYAFPGSYSMVSVVCTVAWILHLDNV